MFEEALEILDRMEQHGRSSQIDHHLYNCNLEVVLKKSQVSKAIVIITTMLKANMIP